MKRFESRPVSCHIPGTEERLGHPRRASDAMLDIAQEKDWDRLQRHNRAMARLVAAVQELSLARTLDAVMAVVRRAARELTGADGASFILRDGNKCFYADEDAIGPLWKGQRFPMSACVSGWVMLHRKPALIPDIFDDPRVPVDAYRPTFVKSLVMVPIRTREPIGAIGTYWAGRHQAAPEEIELLQTLANTTAVALESVQLYGELEQRVRDRTLQLEMANHELEAFSYTVSHDLQSPLFAISGFAELLQASSRGQTEETTRYADNIFSETERMRAIISDLLRLARISRVELKREKIDLTAIAHEARLRFQAADPARVASFEIADGLEAWGDSGLIRVVLENLLSNAWKYSARQAESRIEVGSVPDVDGGIAFFVRDNGAGFDMAKADKLFAPFQRLHTAEEFKGTGVGLSTVQRVILRHGGRIWVEAAPGRGATFWFTLPQRAPNGLL
jgi:signal transduction histidine kinase